MALVRALILLSALLRRPSLLAGLAIFPAVFAFGGKPAGGIAAATPDTPSKVEKKMFKLSDETGAGGLSAVREAASDRRRPSAPQARWR